MIKDRLKALWPVVIQPDISGVDVTYDSAQELVYYNQKVFHMHLGRRTYNQIKGQLTLSQVDFEKLNYNRALNHLKLFTTIAEAVTCLLDEKTEIKRIPLIFIARHFVNNTSTSYNAKKLFKHLGYKTVTTYHPASVEEALTFLEHFSTLEKQEDRSACFGTHPKVAFYTLTVKGEKESFTFCNQNLAVTPKILKRKDFADAQGYILSHYTFEPITIQGHTLTHLIKAYGDLTQFTLVNRKVVDLSLPNEEALLLCPSCGAPLFNNKCYNLKCKEKIIDRAYYMASKEGLNIKGLSKPVLERVYDYIHTHTRDLNLLLPSSSDLFFFVIDETLLDAIGFKPPQARLLMHSITNAKKEQSLDAILCSLNLPGVHKKTVQFIQDRSDKAIENLIIEKMQYDNMLFRTTPLTQEKLHIFKELKIIIDSIT